MDNDTTIGVEFCAKYVTVKDKTLKLQIWDTAGQESFKSITRSYYRGSSAALLVYDITRHDSFEHVGKWLEEIKTYGGDKIVTILIGNKCDLENEREVGYEEAKSFAEKNKMLFLETSAKNAVNVNEAFTKTSELIMQKIEAGEIDPSQDGSGVKVGMESTNFILGSGGNEKEKDDKKKKKPSACCQS